MQVVVKRLHLVMSYMKQTLESVQHRLEIIFNGMHPKILFFKHSLLQFKHLWHTT